MQDADAIDLRPIRDGGKVEAEADLYVLLRHVVLVDQHLANLVGGIRVFTFLRIMVLKQELSITVFDDGC